MKRWAAFLLAAVHGIDAVAIDCSHRTRRICRPDRECVAGARASRPRHHSPRRVAVLLRGVAFRNWGSRGTEGSCCNGTETQQRAVVESLDERLFAPLEARGFEVSVYLSTYRCSNGKDWVERDLLPRLAPRLRGLYIGDEANTTQTQTFARALELAAAEASSREDQSIEAPRDVALAFEHVFILRLDMARAGVGSSLLTLGSPRPRRVICDRNPTSRFHTGADAVEPDLFTRPGRSNDSPHEHGPVHVSPGSVPVWKSKLRRVPTPSMRRLLDGVAMPVPRRSTGAPDTPVDFHTGRYFACAVRTRFSLSFGHKWVAEILSLSGVNRPSGPLLYGASPVGTCVEIKFYAIDATPAR